MTDTISDFNFTGKRIWIAGHRGMVGSALARRLQDENCEVLTCNRKTVNLTRQVEVENWLKDNKPDAIIIAAAKVGGIYANSTLPSSFIYDNLMIAANIIHAAHLCDINHLLFLGSSCIYPREAQQPMAEDALLTGPLEPTNQWYAIAKIAGIRLCDAYRQEFGRNYFSAMPTNLYGPGDNFHPDYSHVPAALLRRFHEAKERRDNTVEIWGTGAPKREFLHVDDLADACTFLLQKGAVKDLVNIGSSHEITIGDFAKQVAQTVGYEGDLVFDTNRPDGSPRKLMDSTRINKMGWSPKIPLEEGLKLYYQWFLENQDTLRSGYQKG